MIFQKGLKDITFNDRVIKETRGNQYRFTLKDTSPRDSGTYWMVARNEIGTDRAFVTITVGVKTIKLDSFNNSYKCSMPMFSCS